MHSLGSRVFLASTFSRAPPMCALDAAARSWPFCCDRSASVGCRPASSRASPSRTRRLKRSCPASSSANSHACASKRHRWPPLCSFARTRYQRSAHELQHWRCAASSAHSGTAAQERAVTIVAKKPSKLYVISAADYERCFEEMPEVTLPLPSAPLVLYSVCAIDSRRRSTPTCRRGRPLCVAHCCTRANADHPHPPVLRRRR